MSNDEIKQVALNELFPLMEEQLSCGKTVTFGPKGTSMLPLIRQGVDKVVLKKFEAPLKKYDIPLYRRADGSFILHRVVKVDKDKTYIMSGDNQTALERGVTDDQILGVVSGVYRGDKFISCKSFSYRIYCRALFFIKLWRKSLLRRVIRGGMRRCKLIK